MSKTLAKCFLEGGGVGGDVKHSLSDAAISAVLEAFVKISPHTTWSDILLIFPSHLLYLLLRSECWNIAVWRLRLTHLCVTE